MPTAISIDSLVTEDVAPAAAPYRISAKAGKDHADFAVTATHDGVYYPCAQLVPPFTPGLAAPIIALRITDGGTDPYSGTVLAREGLVCSDSEPCSDSLPCSDWEVASGTQLVESVTYAEEAAAGTPTEGDHTINVWVCTDRQGWS